MNITIRGVNPQFWRELKIESVKEGLTIGQTVNLALDKWLSEYKKKKESKKKKNFWDMQPFLYKGQDAAQLSAKVDEVLYGEKQ